MAPRIGQPELFKSTTGLKFKRGGGGVGGAKIEHRIGIQASADIIWDIIADLPAWAEWNPLYPSAEGQIHIGEQLKLTLALPGEKPETITPTILDWTPRSLLHWQLKLAAGLVSTIRYIEIDELGPDSCIFSNGEIFQGLLGPRVARQVGRKVHRGFQAMGEAIKLRAEARARS